ncbi:MAG: ribonuclease R [Candidatus Schekmanbacteria bacterium]|nr:ribonuclease R [Candidatus Schekmanbacteria bacterium]
MTINKLREDIIKEISLHKKKSVPLSELAESVGLNRKDRDFKELCRELELEGFLYLEGGTAVKPSAWNLVLGKIKIGRTGDARVAPKDDPSNSIYIDSRDTGDALNGDIVFVKIAQWGRNRRPAGKVVKVVKKGFPRIVGEVEKKSGRTYVIPLPDYRMPDIHLSPVDAESLKRGELVVVEPLGFKQKQGIIEAKLLKVIGKKGEDFIDTRIVVEKYGLPEEFTPSVLEEADRLFEPSEGNIAGRKDFRKLRTVTVDGEKARDFDDAISIERFKEDGYRLYVHIADVSHFVREESAIDREALRRGTSVYFPDYWIPMLPMRLSSGLCSLNPHEDRLTLTVVMNFDRIGNIVKYELFESVINSNERMTYTDLHTLLDGDDQYLQKRYKDNMDDFKLMKELCLILKDKRNKRGSLDFDLPEPEFVLDATGDIVDIMAAERNIAHKLIEEFMIAANETVASHLNKNQVPSIYRIHETPDRDRIKEFNEFLKDLDIGIKGVGKITPKAFQTVLDAVKGLEMEHLISTVLLRSLKHASYSTSTLGHFGLASKYYTHFTSPIRRYPDLMVHRILKKFLKGESGQTGRKAAGKALDNIALSCSVTEKTAENAEREVLDLKKLEYLKSRIGDVLEGVIAGVADFGFFVEISGYYVDGLVRMASMKDDYYILEPEKHRIRGKRRGKIFRIGDKVKVVLDDVHPDRGEMDLRMIVD